MDIKTYEAVINHFRKQGDEQARAKRIEYTESRGDEDVLANFKATAKDIKINPLQVLYTFMKKHWSSMVNYIKTGKEYSTESVLGRIMDLIQYLELTYATILEMTLSEDEIRKIASKYYANERSLNLEQACDNLEKGLKDLDEKLNIKRDNTSDVPEDRLTIKGNLGDPEC